MNTRKRKGNGEYEDDFVICCGDCKNELFRMSSEGREMFDFIPVSLVKSNEDSPAYQFALQNTYGRCLFCYNDKMKI